VLPQRDHPNSAAAAHQSARAPACRSWPRLPARRSLGAGDAARTGGRAHRAFPRRAQHGPGLRRVMEMRMDQLSLTTLDGGDWVVGRPALEQWAACLRGSVLTPADPGYDAARQVWNAMID